MIDAHQHLRRPARGDCGWMPPDDLALTRPYGSGDLPEGLAATGFAQTMVVQAAPSVTGTDHKLGIADHTRILRADVRWTYGVPFDQDVAFEPRSVSGHFGGPARRFHQFE